MSTIPRKKPNVRMVISVKRFMVMFQPSLERPDATRIFTSRWAGVDTTDLGEKKESGNIFI